MYLNNWTKTFSSCLYILVKSVFFWYTTDHKHTHKEMGKELGGGEEALLPLFETKEIRFRGAYKVFVSTVFVGICLIWVYRLTHIPRAGEKGRWVWIGMFMAELWFSLYWILTQSSRFQVVYNYPFKERLLYRLELSPPLSYTYVDNSRSLNKYCNFPARFFFFFFP